MYIYMCVVYKKKEIQWIEMKWQEKKENYISHIYYIKYMVTISHKHSFPRIFIL